MKDDIDFVLLKAADLLEKSEWYQAGMSPDNLEGYHCPITAIRKFEFDAYAEAKACERLAQKINPEERASGAHPNVLIMRFNDKEARSKEEVVAKMREAGKA